VPSTALHPDRAATLASVGLAFDWAETQAANAARAGCSTSARRPWLSTQEPPLVAAEPWGIRERLGFEKTAIGFYLSGHLFDEAEAEVRRFCPAPIAELIDSREPQVLAGIVTDLRVVNGQRGRVASSSSTTAASHRGGGQRGRC
jgi:DNA polymerase-3 subunit alpha